jgi:hypothetical protein
VASNATPDGAATVEGVDFPRVDGARSTSRTGRAVLADAARVVDTALSAAITSEGDWRKAYPQHIRALVEAELRAGEAATGVPPAGLDSLHRRFVFTREDEDLPLHEALAAPTTTLHTAEVRGRGRPA